MAMTQRTGHVPRPHPRGAVFDETLTITQFFACIHETESQVMHFGSQSAMRIRINYSLLAISSPFITSFTSFAFNSTSFSLNKFLLLSFQRNFSLSPSSQVPPLFPSLSSLSNHPASKYSGLDSATITEK